MSAREPIFQALFAAVGAASWGDPPSGFAYASRRVRLFDDLPATPALCQAEHAEEIERCAGQPPRRWLIASLMIQHTVPDPADTPGAVTNNLILDALDRALRPDGPDGCCTLGGLVAHAAVEGDVLKDPGDLDGKALMTVPVRILVP